MPASPPSNDLHKRCGAAASTRAPRTPQPQARPAPAPRPPALGCSSFHSALSSSMANSGSWNMSRNRSSSSRLGSAPPLPPFFFFRSPSSPSGSSPACSARMRAAACALTCGRGAWMGVLGRAWWDLQVMWVAEEAIMVSQPVGASPEAAAPASRRHHHLYPTTATTTSRQAQPPTTNHHHLSSTSLTRGSFLTSEMRDRRSSSSLAATRLAR